MTFSGSEFFGDMIMELVLIRHGESIGNAVRGESAVYTGRWDCEPISVQLGVDSLQ